MTPKSVPVMWFLLALFSFALDSTEGVVISCFWGILFSIFPQILE